MEERERDRKLTSQRNFGCPGEREVTMVMVESIDLSGFPTGMETTPLLRSGREGGG